MNTSKKKRTLVLMLAVIAALALMAPALACGGHGHHGGRQTQVTVCTVEGCTTAGRHVHNGVIYCGYHHESGVCDGNCLALCTVEGCTVSGRHTHDGVVCCGAHHEAGFCDGTCVVSTGHHHGHHH